MISAISERHLFHLMEGQQGITLVNVGRHAIQHGFHNFRPYTRESEVFTSTLLKL